MLDTHEHRGDHTAVIAREGIVTALRFCRAALSAASNASFSTVVMFWSAPAWSANSVRISMEEYERMTTWSSKALSRPPSHKTKPLRRIAEAGLFE